MILSVSRRTDIPAFYSEWFFNRLREGFVLVRNPMNYRQVSHIELNPSVIDGIVFWTKNPAPMMDRLNLLEEYNYYFLVTITPYGPEIEKNIPSKERAVETLQKLAAQIGPARIIWRYDPIIFNAEMNLEYHAEKFEFLASRLKGYTRRCQISFVDFYKKAINNLRLLKAEKPDNNIVLQTGKVLADIAGKYEIKLEACAEKADLILQGISPAKCIDDRLIAEISGKNIRVVKDRNQRHRCGCIASIDIGAYNSCRHGCLYCYASFSEKSVANNTSRHNPNSPMLIGDVEAGDKVTKRKMVSYFKGLEAELFPMTKSLL